MNNNTVRSRSMPESVKKDEQFYLQKWKDEAVQLEDGEIAVQMVNHRPGYFITSHGRVFSLLGKKCKRLKPLTKESLGSKYNHTSCSVQEHIMLCLRKGKRKWYRISKLVEEYFDVSRFNPVGEPEEDCHHIKPYKKEKGNLNNYSDNIQTVGARVHRSIFGSIQNATVTENGMVHKNQKNFYKRMEEMGAKSKKPVMILSGYDKETGKVLSVQGKELTEEELQKLLGNEKIQCIMQGLENKRYELLSAIGEYIDEHPEQIRFKDGVISVIGDIDTSTNSGKKINELINWRL